MNPQFEQSQEKGEMICVIPYQKANKPMSPRINNGEDQGIPVIKEFFIPTSRRWGSNLGIGWAGAAIYLTLIGTRSQRSLYL
jgi:hypothetical protein